jgi:hypothetical protein
MITGARVLTSIADREPCRPIRRAGIARSVFGAGEPEIHRSPGFPRSAAEGRGVPLTRAICTASILDMQSGD